MKQSAQFNPPFNERLVCGECSSGLMKPAFVTYFTWIENDLITVPDFPAWVCDQCGRREYDLDALNRLSMLLSPTVGKSSVRKQPVPSPVPPIKKPRAVRRKTKG